ncbi:hypothetical protein MP228_008309 [Amoeboaphelidium protococcarum]|nr:hypothetical protein MP228_008309 [Amoeboaphelidium protococcarum]
MMIRRLKSTASVKTPSGASQSLQVSKLPNGVTVATDNTSGYFVGLGMYIKAGSRYEDAIGSGDQLQGYSHLAEKLAFKGSLNIQRESMSTAMEEMGGNIHSVSTRENIIYQGTTFAQHIPRLFELYANNVRSPIIDDQVVEDSVAAAEWEVFQQEDRVTEFGLLQLTHQTAFGKNTLGNSQYFDASRMPVGSLADGLRNYVNHFFKPQNIVVAGVGCDHQEIMDLANMHLGDWKAPSATTGKVAAATVSPSKYEGGQCIKSYTPPSHLPPNLKDLTHIQLAFQSPRFNSPDVYAYSVLQTLLGGGDSFSAGGPGKGMYSRLYTNVLNRYYWVESISAQNHSYSDNGIFVYHATVPHHAVTNALKVIGTEIQKVIDSPILDIELQRAKNQLKSQVFLNMESRMVQVEDIGRQVQLIGTRVSPNELNDRIEQVTAQDIKKAVIDMCSTKPTFILLGNTRHAPDLYKIYRQFGFKT